MSDPTGETYKCCKECVHCVPANGHTNCPFFNEDLKIVVWYGRDEIEKLCTKFTEGTLDGIVGVNNEV